MPVSFENKLPDKLLFCTEINRDQESLEGLTIVPGILDNETAELLCINFTNSVRKINSGTKLGKSTLTLPPEEPDKANILSTTLLQKYKKESTEELSNLLNDTDFKSHKQRLLQLLSKYRKAIALPGEQLGKTDLVEHQIVLHEGTAPIRSRAYRTPHSLQKAVKKELERLLKEGIICPCQSDFSSPVVIVHKKDGSIRLCIDYRRLNACTVKDLYTLPHIQDILSNLRGSVIFTTIDLL